MDRSAGWEFSVLLDHNSISEGARMTNPLRLLVMAAALTGTLGSGTAAAQTLFVRNAPAGTTAEIVVHGAPPASGTVGEDGTASVPFSIAQGQTEIDANVFVDICGTVRRVIVVDRGRIPAPAAEGCDRRDIPGVFWVRSVNTLVIDFAGVSPTLLLIKGRYT